MLELFRIADLHIKGRKEGYIFLVNNRSNEIHKVTQPELDLLMMCRFFAPLEVHRNNFIKNNKSSYQFFKKSIKIPAQNNIPKSYVELDDCIFSLKNFYDKRLLDSETDIKKQFLPQVEKNVAQETKIGMIAFPTCDRPSNLKRSVASFLSNAKEFNRFLTLTY